LIETWDGFQAGSAVAGGELVGVEFGAFAVGGQQGGDVFGVGFEHAGDGIGLGLPR